MTDKVKNISSSVLGVNSKLPSIQSRQPGLNHGSFSDIKKNSSGGVKHYMHSNDGVKGNFGPKTSNLATIEKNKRTLDRSKEHSLPLK